MVCTRMLAPNFNNNPGVNISPNNTSKPRRERSMRFLSRISFLVLASGMALAQAGSAGQAQNSSVTDQLKALKEAVSAQQAQIAQQQKQIETLEKALAEKSNAAPHVENAALTTTTAPATATTQADVQKPKESPLSFRIGGTDFTPGGFVDFQNIFRSVNLGSSVSTSFGAIPFSNTPRGQLTEFRSTGQYSRFDLKITGRYGANKVTGYIESDFNGNDPASVFLTTNPHTLRLRQFYVNVRRGKWEFTAGQAYGLISPNRSGVSPFGGDLALTTATDGNVHVGVAYVRDGQFRVAFHPTENFAMAVSLENPQQTTGGEVVIPDALSGQLANQINGNSNAGVPNAFPDIVGKMAYDTKIGWRAFHVEGGGMITSAKLAAVPDGSPAGTPFAKHTKIGAGAIGGMNFEVVKKVRFYAYGEYGTGLGRYVNGLGPQFVVAPVALTPTVFDFAISMVHSTSGWLGLETRVTPKTLVSAYYGGVYFGRNAFTDITSTDTPQPIIGFGGVGSGSNNNRSVQQGSLVLTETLWKNSQYGALLLINDASYLTRSPWFVPTGQPKNAHMFMDHLVLRYVIP